jgi:hypothetical protein
MAKMENSIRKIGKDINERCEKYTALLKEFDTYRGRQLTEEDVAQVNIILMDIQELYNKEIFPLFSFIKVNYATADTAMIAHEQFINDINALQTPKS